MARKKLPTERTKYLSPVSQEDIDGSKSCNMNDCMAYHSVTKRLAEQFPADANPRGVSATPTGFNFKFDGDGKVWKAICLFGTRTARRIFRRDEIYLRTRSETKAKASVKPFVAEWWVEEIVEMPGLKMTKADKERLAGYESSGERSNTGRRAFSFGFPK